MTDFNQKTHDTDVGSHGGQLRQMTEVFENQEFGSIRVLQEAGKTFFCASDVAKALGYVNPYAAVKRHCRGPLTKREGVVQKVNQYFLWCLWCFKIGSCYPPGTTGLSELEKGL